jgi:AraC-like DNA-binding protein
VIGYWLLGREVLQTAFRNLIKGHVFDENFLMSIATLGAFLIGEYPEAVGVMLFYRVGEYFEHRAVERSRKQIMEAVDLRPEVVHLVNGEDVIEIPAEEAEPGDLLLMQSSEAHFIELDVAEPYERKVLHVDAAVLRSIDPKGVLISPLLDRKPGKQNLFKSHQFRQGCEHYFDTMMLPGEEPRIHIFAGLIGLLHELVCLRAQEDTQAETAHDTPAYRIIRYLNKNLDKNILLEDICRQFYISKSQLCRVFRASTGTTVRQYLTLKRLIKARQLIEAGVPATHAYLQCGFSDYSSFYRAYTKHFGHAPSK